MIYLTGEGETVRNGINLYRLSDPSSAGFKLRLGRYLFMLRWSKGRQRFFVRSEIVPGHSPDWMKGTK